jgi:long-chain acyl-CoA synthetase
LLHQVEETKDENGRDVEKLHLGEYSWITYAQLGKRVDDVASGLVEFAGLKAKDKVIIYADTKADWLVSEITW